MEIKQLSEFIVECVKRCDKGCHPWINLFNEKFCNKCKPIIGYYPNTNTEVEFAPCETPEGCPYGVGNLTEEQMVAQWLLSEWKGME